MKAKYYTLAEARAALPRVRQCMETVQAARREIMRLRPDAWPAVQKAAQNGGNHAAGELAEQFRRLEMGMKGILSMGIYVKDVEQGLVDFLGKRNDREVFLCWRYGEEDILYWHEIDLGFAGRQPIDPMIQ